MIDNAELIELFESELEFLFNKAHKSGLTWLSVLRILTKSIQALTMKVDVENSLKLRGY